MEIRYGQYVVKEANGLIKSGNHGCKVYLAHKQGTGIDDTKCYALKVIPLSLSIFNNEAEICKEFSISVSLKHPHITNCYEIVKTQNDSTIIELVIVMDYCNQGNLEEYLIKNTISEAQAINLLYQICEGYTLLYDKHVMHRDMKTENIVLHQENPGNPIIAKITDFGSSKLLNAIGNMSGVQTDSYVGTPAFMAPEVLSQSNYDYRCDIYSIGVIYYRMLFNKFPFYNAKIKEHLKAIQEGTVYFDTTTRAVSAESIAFISQCLQYDPKDRISAKCLLSHSVFKLLNQTPIKMYGGIIVKSNINPSKL